MARNIGADGSTVYRAVITKTYDNGREWTSHEGPYTEPGPARARVTFWHNRMQRNGGTAEGHVEQAHTIWAPLDGKEQRPAERAAAAIRAQAYRDAADEMEACQAAAVRDMAAHLRKRADAIHPAAQEPTP